MADSIEADAPAPTRAEAGSREQVQSRQRAAARPWVRLGMVIVLAGLVGGGLYYWYITRDEESTDDAYTDGRAVPIAPHVNGYVISLDINDNQFVHKGAPLLHIDPRDYQAAL